MQIGYVERFNRSYREGVLDAYILTTIDQAREETAIWIEDYNNNHPHDSLDDHTPTECIYGRFLVILGNGLSPFGL